MASWYGMRRHSRADEIKLLHGEIEGALRTSVEKAVRIGELLGEQKAELKHGEWLPWVEANLPFTEDTAQRYMRVFNDRGLLENRNVRYLTDAYRALGIVAVLKLRTVRNLTDGCRGSRAIFPLARVQPTSTWLFTKVERNFHHVEL